MSIFCALLLVVWVDETQVSADDVGCTSKEATKAELRLTVGKFVANLPVASVHCSCYY